MQQSFQSQKQLEIALSRLKWPDDFKNGLEQYPTDPALAAKVAVTAYLDGNVNGKTAADLGAGFGILSCAFAMLGSKEVFAVEIDPKIGEIGRINCAGLPVTFIQEDVANFHQYVDTVVMNPPFGSVKPHQDRVFLEKAMSISRVIYSIHNAKSAGFVRTLYSKNGRIIRDEPVHVKVPRLYGHHTRKWMDIPAVFLTAVVENPGSP